MLFLPPIRGVNFVEDTQDDGRFVDEVARWNGITKTEAARAVKQEVVTIKQTILQRGYIVLQGIGHLQMADNGRLELIPPVCGIDAPSLYGLDSCYAPQLPIEIELANYPSVVVNHDDDKISIRRIVRYAVAAIAFVAFCLVGMSDTVAPRDLPQPLQKEGAFGPILLADKLKCPLPSEREEVRGRREKVGGRTEKVKQNVAKASKSSSTKKSDKVRHRRKLATAKPNTEPKSPPYTIVVSSAIPAEGAQRMAAALKRAGHQQTRVLKDRRMIRVVYGCYTSDAEAHAALRQKRNTGGSEFAQAWVYKIP